MLPYHFYEYRIQFPKSSGSLRFTKTQLTPIVKLITVILEIVFYDTIIVFLLLHHITLSIQTH